MTTKLKTTYETVIGLEIHVQLDTKTKMFCRCDNDSDNAEPNTNVCPVCMGYPGVLPVINNQAIEWGIKTALALGCEINPMQRFDRKNYFYPDLPKGYQISQFFYPVGENGVVEVDYLAQDRKTKKEFKLGITRLHLEEDAGKLVHAKGATLVDLNRCGTPLAEIVTEPDIKSPEEARAFLQELQRIVRTIGVSKADMEKGHLRVDANVSVRPKGQKEFGTKVEVKNINSFKFVEKALKYEVGRQIEVLENGGTIDQETRGWDEKNNQTIPQRGKEGDIDYRYFPEPDLPPIYVSEEQIKNIQKNMEDMPSLLRRKAEEFGLPYDRISELQDIATLEYNPLVGYVKLMGSNPGLDPVKVVNMLIKILALGRKEDAGIKITDDMWQKALEIVVSKKDSFTAKDSDIEVVAKSILELEKEVVERYKKGEEKLFGYLVGQVMAKMKGTAEPALVQQILKKLLTK
ncbi:Asp-tRNA(Asn)/Glu-tRNA(Gln) amidotransferase GatCAB subunit B [candidate division Kazan bacterium]|uniref:Aspartyl/glutamyl-tRNA(Asn/Gln) amidotransferase subunit B n=1 Tax=candidate division Kazan bacterium TaxID=2202143 RepID=A0A420ZE08_UNCK3|nr:MAG: Asp-tRNA(Asn)/Glu-tRNA(Gln) amidotransferase GatCAB subunit B [candidate division Kazan bacterium]